MTLLEGESLYFTNLLVFFFFKGHFKEITFGKVVFHCGHFICVFTGLNNGFHVIILRWFEHRIF